MREFTLDRKGIAEFAGYFGDKPDVLIEFEKLCTVVYKRTQSSPARFVVSPEESFALTFYYTGSFGRNAYRVTQIIDIITRQVVPIEVVDPRPQPTVNLDDTVELPLDIEGRTEIITVRRLVDRYESQRESIKWFQART
jgi:hypothetical protein